MDRTTRPLVIVAAFAGSLLVGLLLMLWALGGLRNVAAPAAIGGPFQLTDQAGQTVTEKNLQGRPTLIFFGFTHCPDICPTSLFEISEVLRAMGKDADRVNAYFISVDPERDTTAAMKDYLSSFDPHLKGLTGDPNEVAKVISAYRAYAQNPAKRGAEAARRAVPGFWDPRRRPDRPDLSRLSVIRFLTETDYPPFNFTGPDGNPAGFNVDLARQLCEEIKVTCTIQMRRFETLLDAIASNRGDAIIASLAVTPQMRARVDFTDPYYRAPARFVSRRDAVMPEVRPEYLEGKKVGAIAGSSHEAYLKALFTDAELHSYPNDDALRQGLRRGEVDFIFGDAISLAFWINGTDSGECCGFSGGPFVESRYFGEGIGIAVRKGNDLLRQSLNWALFRLWEKGRYTDLWLRYFSVSPF